MTSGCGGSPDNPPPRAAAASLAEDVALARVTLDTSRFRNLVHPSQRNTLDTADFGALAKQDVYRSLSPYWSANTDTVVLDPSVDNGPATAVATVSVTGPDLMQFLRQAPRSIRARVAKASMQGDTEQLNEVLKEVLPDPEADSALPRQTKTSSVYLAADDGNWFFVNPNLIDHQIRSARAALRQRDTSRARRQLENAQALAPARSSVQRLNAEFKDLAAAWVYAPFITVEIDRMSRRLTGLRRRSLLSPPTGMVRGVLQIQNTGANPIRGISALLALRDAQANTTRNTRHVTLNCPIEGKATATCTFEWKTNDARSWKRWSEIRVLHARPLLPTE